MLNKNHLKHSTSLAVYYVLNNIDTCLIIDLNYAPQGLGLTPSFVCALSCTVRGMGTTIVSFDKAPVARYSQGVDEDCFS